MYLADAWDSILARKADEAPGGEAPLQTVWTFPGYDPAKEPSYQPAPPAGTPAPQVVITAPRPQPLPVQVGMVRRPAFNPWPWAALAAALVGAALLMKSDTKRPARPARKPAHA